MSLPSRMTGLRTGRAGERRGGVPRTEAERYTRHYGTTYQTSNGTATIGKICVVGGLVAVVAGVLILGLRK
ncbi:hypothetical protein ES702_00764 [subsurface metagenome]